MFSNYVLAIDWFVNFWADFLWISDTFIMVRGLHCARIVTKLKSRNSELTQHQEAPWRFVSFVGASHHVCLAEYEMLDVLPACVEH